MKIGSLEELDRVRDECKSMVTRRCVVSAGAAAVPLPGVDVAVDIGLLATLLPNISERFGVDQSSLSKLDPEITRQMLVIATSLGNNLIGQLVTKELIMVLLKKMGVRVATKSVMKYIPIIGSVMSASISFGMMKLVGNRHVDDCYKTMRSIIEGAQAKSADAEAADAPISSNVEVAGAT